MEVKTNNYNVQIEKKKLYYYIFYIMFLQHEGGKKLAKS